MNEPRNKNLDRRPPVGPVYWRSLEERHQTPESRAWLDHEFFPPPSDEPHDDVHHRASRRQFLRLMAASMSLAGVTAQSGCRRPVEKILPYNQKPEDIIPGRPLYYATTMVMAASHQRIGYQLWYRVSNATMKTRRKATKAAAFTPVAMNAVMGAGAPS